MSRKRTPFLRPKKIDVDSIEKKSMIPVRYDSYCSRTVDIIRVIIIVALGAQVILF